MYSLWKTYPRKGHSEVTNTEELSCGGDAHEESQAVALTGSKLTSQQMLSDGTKAELCIDYEEAIPK